MVTVTDKISITYYSPYTFKAEDQIRRLKKSLMLGSPKSGPKHEDIKEKRIEESFEKFLKCNDSEDSSNTDRFLNLLNTHCGLSSESDLFRGIDKKESHEKILSGVLIKMADKIRAQQFELGQLELESRGSQPSKTQTKTILKTPSRSLLKSPKASKTPSLKSLGEEENNENSSSFLLHAYPQSKNPNKLQSLVNTPPPDLRL